MSNGVSASSSIIEDGNAVDDSQIGMNSMSQLRGTATGEAAQVVAVPIPDAYLVTLPATSLSSPQGSTVGNASSSRFSISGGGGVAATATAAAATTATATAAATAAAATTATATASAVLVPSTASLAHVSTEVAAPAAPSGFRITSIEERLRNFFELHDQRKVERIPSLLEKNRGRESQMITAQELLYSATFPPALVAVEEGVAEAEAIAGAEAETSAIAENATESGAQAGAEVDSSATDDEQKSTTGVLIATGGGGEEAGKSEGTSDIDPNSIPKDAVKFDQLEVAQKRDNRETETKTDLLRPVYKTATSSDSTQSAVLESDKASKSFSASSPMHSTGFSHRLVGGSAMAVFASGGAGAGAGGGGGYTQYLGDESTSKVKPQSIRRTRKGLFLYIKSNHISMH